jgi:hypothetical protein
LPEDEKKCYQNFWMSKHRFNYLLQKTSKRYEKEYYLPRSNITSGETRNL